MKKIQRKIPHELRTRVDLAKNGHRYYKFMQFMQGLKSEGIASLNVSEI